MMFGVGVGVDVAQTLHDPPVVELVQPQAQLTWSQYGLHVPPEQLVEEHPLSQLGSQYGEHVVGVGGLVFVGFRVFVGHGVHPPPPVDAVHPHGQSSIAAEQYARHVPP